MGVKPISAVIYDKYKYSASKANDEYRDSLINTRIGVKIKQLGLLIKPLLAQSQSVYAILQNHPEIKLSEKTLYHYIEDGDFQNAGVPIRPGKRQAFLFPVEAAFADRCRIARQRQSVGFRNVCVQKV